MAFRARIRRRTFLALLGGVTAFPPAALAQRRPKKIPRIGIIDDGPIWESFRDAMRAAGYVEGQTITYEYRASGGDRGQRNAGLEQQRRTQA